MPTDVSPYMTNDSAAITAEALNPGGVPAAPDTHGVPAASGGGPPQPAPTPSQDTSSLPANTRSGVANPVQASGPKHSIMSDILHAIGEVLGGPSTVQRVNPQTGKIEDVPLSRSSRIANAAGMYIRGAAAGAAQHGPGSVGKAALAGAQEQQQFQQQQTENTLESSKNVQAQLAGTAARALQAQQIAESGWRMAREGTEMDQVTADKFNAMQDLVSSNPQNKDLGHYPSFADFLKAHPELVKAGVSVPDLMREGKIRVTVTTENGKSTGIQAYQVNPDWEKQKTEKPVIYQEPDGFDKNGNPKFITKEIPAGRIGNGEALTLTGAKAQKEMEDKERAIQLQNETARAKSEIEYQKAGATNLYAEAKKAAAETGVKGAEEMINTGINPFTHEQMNITNAPDTQPIDSKGQPIPFKSLTFMKPSQQETNRASFAKSTLHILDTLDDLRSQGKMKNGPISGLYQQALAKAGLTGRDSQDQQDLISLAQTAATGAHVGGRFSVEVLNKMQQLLKMNMNDEGFAGAEDALRNVMQGYIGAGGRQTVGEWKQDHAIYAQDGTTLLGYATPDGTGMIPAQQKK